MKEKLSALPIDPQKIGIPFSPSFHDTDMLPNERLFVSGLIKYYEPKHILEVGVAGGGGYSKCTEHYHGYGCGFNVG